MKLKLKQKNRMAGTLAAALMLSAAAPAGAADARAWTWQEGRESDLVEIIAYKAMPSPSPELLTGHLIDFVSTTRPSVKGQAFLFCKPSLANCTAGDFAVGATLRAQPPRVVLRAGNSTPDFTVACVRDERGQVANCSAIGSLVPSSSIGGGQ